MTSTTGQSQADEQVFDLLRLNDAAHRQLIEALDRRMAKPEGSERRQDTRHRYMISLGILAFVKQGSVELRAIVRPRNISRSGLGFFHGGFLNKGTRCLFDLKTRAGEFVQRRGTVRFCRHIFSHIHEVGAAFDTPIDVEEFVEGTGATVEDAESTIEKQFTGHVLCVDGSQVDRALFQFHSVELGAHVAEADDAPEGLDLAFAADFDLVICRATLPSMSGQEFVQTLREDDYRGPVCIWSDDAGSARNDEGHDRYEVMPKPFDIENIIGLLKRHLPPVASDPVVELPSNLWSQKRLRPLILSYLDVLAEQTPRLDSDPVDGADQLFALIKEIRNSAGSYGYPAISEAAGRLLEQSPSDDLRRWVKNIRQLKALCTGACLFGKRLADPTGPDHHEATP